MPSTTSKEGEGRRTILATLLMGAGLLAGYGLGLFHFLRYLVPIGGRAPKREMFVGTLTTLPVGSSMTVRDPSGQDIAIARTGDDPSDPASGFRALSSKCPHLGCKVHYSAGRQQFICPCHNGIFDADGVAVSGPPAKENKNLATYDVKVNSRNGWVFVMISSGRIDGRRT